MDITVVLVASVCVFLLSLFFIDPILWRPTEVAQFLGTSSILAILTAIILFLLRRGKKRLPKSVSIPLLVLMAVIILGMAAYLAVWIIIADAFRHFEI